MIDILILFGLGVLLVFGLMIIMGIVVIMSNISAHKVLEQEKEHRAKILDEHFIEWWPQWKVKLEQSFNTIPRRFKKGSLNEKQILILYALVQAGGELQLRELIDLWGDQTIGANQFKFRRDLSGLGSMVFSTNFDDRHGEYHETIISLDEESGHGADYLIKHKII